MPTADGLDARRLSCFLLNYSVADGTWGVAADGSPDLREIMPRARLPGLAVCPRVHTADVYRAERDPDPTAWPMDTPAAFLNKNGSGAFAGQG
jgi:hypothetical protein